VAQILNRMTPLEVFRELEINEHAGCQEVCRRKEGSNQESYSTVNCQTDWRFRYMKMVDADAISPQSEPFVRFFEDMVTPQPVYVHADKSREKAGEISNADMFGVGGVLRPALSFAARDGSSGDIRTMVHMMTRIAVNIADIWGYTIINGYRLAGDYRLSSGINWAWSSSVNCSRT
jgi:hypothetical protein